MNENNDIKELNNSIEDLLKHFIVADIDKLQNFYTVENEEGEQSNALWFMCTKEIKINGRLIKEGDAVLFDRTTGKANAVLCSL